MPDKTTEVSVSKGARAELEALRNTLTKGQGWNEELESLSRAAVQALVRSGASRKEGIEALEDAGLSKQGARQLVREAVWEKLHVRDGKKEHGSYTRSLLVALCLGYFVIAAAYWSGSWFYEQSPFQAKVMEFLWGKPHRGYLIPIASLIGGISSFQVLRFQRAGLRGLVVSALVWGVVMFLDGSPWRTGVGGIVFPVAVLIWTRAGWRHFEEDVANKD